MLLRLVGGVTLVAIWMPLLPLLVPLRSVVSTIKKKVACHIDGFHVDVILLFLTDPMAMSSASSVGSSQPPMQNTFGFGQPGNRAWLNFSFSLCTVGPH